MSIDNDNEIKWEELKNLSAREIEKESRKILSIMTLEEKVNQMSGDATIFREGLSMLKRYNAKPITAGTDRKLGIPGIKFTDGPRGVVMGNSTCFPVSMARGATWDIDLEQKVGDIIGIEAKAQGANFFGGVCINLLRHPLWGRAQETYGEDPIILGKMGVALLKGVQKHDFAFFHPGGNLGRRLMLRVKDIMQTGNNIPIVFEDEFLIDGIKEINRKNLGFTLAVDRNRKLKGIITDGDIRRLIAKGKVLENLKVKDVMTKNPKTIDEESLAVKAMEIMEKYEITCLAIVDKDKIPKGIIHLHDLLGKKEFRIEY